MKRNHGKPDFPGLHQALRKQLPNSLELECVFCAENKLGMRFANNSITQNLRTHLYDVTLQVSDGSRVIKTTVDTLDPKILSQALKDAQTRLPLMQPLQEPLEPIGSSSLKVEAGTSNVDSSLEATRSAIEALCSRAKSDRLDAAGFIETAARHSAYFNDRGAAPSHSSEATEYRISLKGRSATGSDTGTAQSLSAPSLDQIYTDLAAVASDTRDAKPVAAGSYRVVLGPNATGPMLLFLGAVGFSTRGIVEGASKFSMPAGQSVVSPLITISEDVGRSPGQTACPFDLNGFDTKRVTMIEKGAHVGLVTDQRYASMLGLANTGHGALRPNPEGPIPRSLIWEAGNETLESMLKMMGTGLYVHHFHYVNVHNPKELVITGLTRDGVYWVENGEIQGPCQNLRFTIPLVETLARVQGVGSDVRSTGGLWGSIQFQAPTVMIDSFTFTSTTGFAG